MAFNFIAAAGFNFLKDMHSQSKARAEARRANAAAAEAARIARQIPGGRSLGTAGNAGTFGAGRIFNPDADTSEQPPISDQGFVPGLHTDFTPSVAESGAGDATQRFVEGGLGKGDVFVSGGIRYVYDGYEWLPQGDPLNAGQLQPSVEFMADAFANTLPAENGQPFPIWANGRRGANPIAMSYHVNQMAMVQIRAFVQINTSLEIPLVDSLGDPIMDTAVPPMYQLRQRPGFGTDVTDDYNTVQRTFSGASTNVKGFAGSGHASGSPQNNTENPHYSVTFRLEKVPKPHWVCRITFDWNKISISQTYGTTIIIHCIGPGSYVPSETSREVGTTGTFGHYFLDIVGGGQFFNTAGDVTKFDEMHYAHYEDYIAANTSTVFWLTDDALVTGNSLFAAHTMPFVRLYGDHQFPVDRGTNEQTYQSATIGVGVGPEGIWGGNEDPAGVDRSIQNQQTDVYSCYSNVEWVPAQGRWLCEVFNLSGANNDAGVPRSSADRHFTVHIYGRKS